MSALNSYLAELAEHGYRESDGSRFLSAWEQLEAAYFAHLARAIKPAGQWRECFRSGAAETARLVDANPAAARFVVLDAPLAGDLGRERQLSLVDRLSALLETARSELADPERVPDQTGAWIVGTFFTRIGRCLAGPGPPDLTAQLPELAFLAISAYFGTEVGREELRPLG